MPFTIDWPNLEPRPDSASAAALSVTFSLTGSTFSEIEVRVSNSVLNSVVTVEVRMTSELASRARTGLRGLLSATYLLPKIVVARMSASTLAGIMAR